jgi:hypothetical protein
MDFNTIVAASQSQPDKKIITVYRKENAVAPAADFTVQPLLVNYFELTVAGAINLPPIKSLLGALPAVAPAALAAGVSPGFYIDIYVSNYTGGTLNATFAGSAGDTIIGKSVYGVLTTETWLFKAFVVGPTNWSIVS